MTTIKYLAPLWLNLFLLLSASAYLLAMFVVSSQLRRNHSGVWNDLGRPFAFDLNSVVSALKLARYALFSGQHKALNDSTLSLSVYTARVLLIVVLLAMYLARIYGYQITASF